jgi:hypothetical protein
MARPRPRICPAEARISRIAANAAPNAPAPTAMASTANAPPTSAPLDDRPSPEQTTMMLTRIDPIPATRLPTARPDTVGLRAGIAMPNGVPGTGSIRTGLSRGTPGGSCGGNGGGGTYG